MSLSLNQYCGYGYVSWDLSHAMMLQSPKCVSCPNTFIMMSQAFKVDARIRLRMGRHYFTWIKFEKNHDTSDAIVRCLKKLSSQDIDYCIFKYGLDPYLPPTFQAAGILYLLI